MGGMDLRPPHYTNVATKGMPHEAGPERCWCLDSEDVLRAEVERLRVQVAEGELTIKSLADNNAALVARVHELEAEVARRREQIGQAFDAMEGRALPKTRHYTKYPCHCGAMISNSGHAAQSHLRGSIHRQNMERKALGLDPV